MKRLHLLLVIIVFFFVGELFVRFDKKTQLFGSDQVVKISTEIGSSKELKLLNENKFPVNDDNALRIMVLGDSYIYGGGIDFKKNFSHQLESLLKKSKILSKKRIYVLDVSRPSNNNLDNYNTYFMYTNKFKPQIVILGYNLNDIKDNLEKSIDDTLLNTGVASLPKKAIEKKNLTQKAYNFMWNSEIFHFLSNNANKFLKSKGVIIPNTGFDEKISSYVLNQSNWRKSKELLGEMITDANTNKIKFVFMLMPEIDMLEYPQLFTKADTVIKNYLISFPNLTFINGREIFKGKSSNEFCLSKYDGHPNENGHKFMAIYIYNVIEKYLVQDKK